MDYLNSLLITILIAMVLAGCSQNNDRQADTENETGPEITQGMLQHNVYFYLKEDVTAEEREQFEKGLIELLSIEEVYDYQIGVPAGTEERDVTDHSFGYSFFSWFKNLDDYQIYAEHPDHLEFIDTYSDLWADVRVYDSEVMATE